MEKIVGFCANCNGVFPERFKWCPDCGGSLQLTRLAPIGGVRDYGVASGQEAPREPGRQSVSDDRSPAAAETNRSEQKVHFEFETARSDVHHGALSQRVVGFVGSGILLIGVFTPIISIPIFGTLSLFDSRSGHLPMGSGTGIVLILLVAYSLFVNMLSKYKFLFLSGLASLAIVLISFLFLNFKLAEMRAIVTKGLGDDPIDRFIGGIGEAIVGTVQLQWGWAVLIIGASTLVLATFFKRTASADEGAVIEDLPMLAGLTDGLVVTDGALKLILGGIVGAWVIMALIS